VFVGICLLAVLATTSVASAVKPTKMTEPKVQVTPGLTERTIIGQLQVAQYKITGVNHLGYIHFEIWFDRECDCDLWLVRASDGKEIGGFGADAAEGELGEIPGYESIDYYVDSVTNTATDPLTHEIVGDTYYLVVTAFNGTTAVKIRGYTPRITTGS